jgi:hypothetical protein
MNIEDERNTDDKLYTDEEIQELEDKSLTAGFDRVRGEIAPTADAAAAEEETLPDTMTDIAQKVQAGLPDRLRRLEGTIGGMTERVERSIETAISKLATAPAAAKTDEPSQADIVTALKDPAAMEELMTEYPAFAPVGDEMKALRQELAMVDGKISASEERIATKQTADRKAAEQNQEQIALEAVHGTDWLQTANSVEFIGYALEDGPSAENYQYIQQMYANARANQTGSPEADRVVNGWSTEYPGWWVNRGANLFGDTQGAIEILSQFKAKDGRPGVDLAAKAKRQRRTATSTVVDGKSGSPTAQSENERFNIGFNRVNQQLTGSKR